MRSLNVLVLQGFREVLTNSLCCKICEVMTSSLCCSIFCGVLKGSLCCWDCLKL